MDLLPYYFKEQDTYKVNGKGLLERYLDIFGAYFDNIVINDISTLDDIIDIDNTPELYLGYLWEFLGSMPYANPKAIDPKKWKQYFNGFDSDSTIESLSRLWVYRKDSDGDHYNLNINQVRALVKYSVALFSIRGTKKFFEILLRLYGFDVEISNGSTYPKTTSVDNDDADYWGSNTDYWGSDDDYAGSIDSLFEVKTEATKLDSEWLNLDEDTIDKHSNCTSIVNVNFKLKSNYVYNTSSNEFKRLQDRMFNLINLFLPIGTRPHIIWDNVNVGNNYVSKVTRSIEVYVNRTPINWTSSDNVFVPSSEYPGWYRVYYRTANQSRNFSWLPLKFMVKVKDNDTTQVFTKDQPKKFVVAFDGINYSDVEYEDGHIFTLNPGGNGLYFPKFKVSVICEEDFNLSNGSISTFIISNWLKEFNYTIFKHLNPSSRYELSINSDYIPVIVQSASVRTYTNDANPDDDTFVPQQVVNLTTGEYLTLCRSNTTLPNRQGNPVSYSAYQNRCVYVQHLFNPGIYEFAMLDRPEYRFKIEVTRVNEVLSSRLVEGLIYNLIDNDNPNCYVRLMSTSNLNFLKNIDTLPITFGGGELPSTIISAAAAQGNSPAVHVGNYNNKPYYVLKSTNLYNINSNNRSTPLTFSPVFLSNAVHSKSQYIRFVVREFINIDHPDWFEERRLTLYLTTGNIEVEEITYSTDIDDLPVYNYRYGDNVLDKNGDPWRYLFNISDIIENTGIIESGTTTIKGIGSRTIGIFGGIESIRGIAISSNSNTFYIEYSGLYDDEVLIKETSNPVAHYWNNGELIELDDPGYYRFYGINSRFNDVVSNYRDISVLSNKYNARYYLEVEDGDKSDDEAYMVRTLIPRRPEPGSTVSWGFNFCITLDKSIVEAQDIQIIDPNAFDFEVLLYRGGTPNRGIVLDSYTADVEVLVDDLGNLLPHYKVRGTIQLSWDGSYDINGNYPPGLYCVELHDKNHVWPDTPSYRVVDAYVIPQKFDGNLYFDVDVISKAWTSPAGQVYDIDPITGKYTWGWFKTNDEYLNSVRLVRYDPSIDTPQFRLKLTNNTIGYTRVYMYKLVENGVEWDNDASYPPVLSPVIKSTTPNTGIVNLHWLDEAIPKDWGFPGEYNSEDDRWDYGKGSTGVVGYTGRWLFTGSVYQLGEIITGPQEPGKYLFLVNQLDVDTKVINYAYLEVKEDIKYSLIVDPLLAILQGTAVGTKVDAVSSAKFTKETLAVTVIPPNSTEILEYHELPYAFYAYQAGTYNFKLYKFEGGQWVYLDLMASFKVLTDNGISDEYLNWEWSDVSEREIQVVTTSSDVDWSVKVQNE